MESSKELVSAIAQEIYDMKGFNILAIDVREISEIADYFIIAEGNVDRHVKAISRSILSRLSELGQSPAHVEGVERGDWVVIDCLNVVVHLFLPQIRQRYRLEDLWQKGEVVDLKIKVDSPSQHVIQE